ncbi:hypothetical protein [Actinoplanes sp. NPDC049265]|uniref:RipA family octameric membrane protein n=1 Tax=Actinoplanes sp. NPDC049265 TaxID=3363902 RepID=UPI00371E1178
MFKGNRFPSGSRSQVSIEELRDSLWTSIDPAAYEGSGEKYQVSLMEQYKIYVEMTDRVSARRSLNNTFFLVVNAGIIAGFGPIASYLERGGVVVLIPLVMLIFQCAVWYFTLRSYRQLGSVKYRVIGVLEERLPASPYWSAEWKAVGQGKRQGLYLPITRLEQVTPAIFGIAYLVVLLLVAT